MGSKNLIHPNAKCLLTALFMSGKVGLHVSISAILFDIAWFFWFSR